MGTSDVLIFSLWLLHNILSDPTSGTLTSLAHAYKA